MQVKIKFDKKAIEEKVLSSKKFQAAVTESMSRKIVKARTHFLTAFSEHKVTQELAAGKTASNTSGSLSGYGNLFTFMGFEDGNENPAISLKKFLDQSISSFANVVKRSGTRFTLRLNVPTKEEIEAITPLPYESGRSWVRGIEYGISGIGFYFYSKKEELENSRSKLGIQSKYQIRGGGFSNQSYLSPLLKQLYKEIGIK